MIKAYTIETFDNEAGVWEIVLTQHADKDRFQRLDTDYDIRDEVLQTRRKAYLVLRRIQSACPKDRLRIMGHTTDGYVVPIFVDSKWQDELQPYYLNAKDELGWLGRFISQITWNGWWW